jgi:hypothetical protein
VLRPPAEEATPEASRAPIAQARETMLSTTVELTLLGVGAMN